MKVSYRRMIVREQTTQNLQSWQHISDRMHNKQILSPANSAGCDVNPLRGFPR
jgi:hypothetical protein